MVALQGMGVADQAHTRFHKAPLVHLGNEGMLNRHQVTDGLLPVALSPVLPTDLSVTYPMVYLVISFVSWSIVKEHTWGGLTTFFRVGTGAKGSKGPSFNPSPRAVYHTLFCSGSIGST